MNQAAFFYPEVRDLVWSLEAPGLLNPLFPGFQDHLVPDEWGREQLREHRDSLSELDQSPDPLVRFMDERPGKGPLLGRYFEALLTFWLTYFIKPDRMIWNLPVRRGSRTIGEFDLLYQQARDSIGRHLEASVKFYLHVPDRGAVDLRHFVGTFVQDRLDLKVAAMMNRQLRLGFLPEAREQLAALGFRELRSQAFFKGALFYPSDRDWRHHPYPPEVSSDHSRGWWTVSRPLVLPRSSEDSRWVVLQKGRWLSPFLGFSQLDQRALTEEEIRAYCQAHFSAHLAPLMLAEVIPGFSGLWQEVSRGLVVFPGWPETALLEVHSSRSFKDA